MKTDHSDECWSRGLHHASDLIIKRGSAMGPLLPLLLLEPILLGSLYAFRSSAIIQSILLFIIIGIPIEYCRQYASFAKRDPDRLQSEDFRYEMKKLHMIASKELSYPIPAVNLALSSPIANPALPQSDISTTLDLEGKSRSEDE